MANLLLAYEVPYYVAAFNIFLDKAIATKDISTSISSPTTDSWVWVVPFVIIAAITWKLKRRKGKYGERQHFPDSVKEKVLEKQRHRCADCNRVLNVVDWHHKNRDRSDNRESNCKALCPNCHAITTRRHQ